MHCVAPLSDAEASDSTVKIEHLLLSLSTNSKTKKKKHNVHQSVGLITTEGGVPLK